MAETTGKEGAKKYLSSLVKKEHPSEALLEQLSHIHTVHDLLIFDKQVSLGLDAPKQAELMIGVLRTGMLQMLMADMGQVMVIEDGSKEAEGLHQLEMVLQGFAEASDAINQKLLELIPDASTLQHELERLGDGELRERLLWKWGNLQS